MRMLIWTLLIATLAIAGVPNLRAAPPTAQFSSGNFNFRAPTPAPKTVAASNLAVIIHGYGSATDGNGIPWPVDWQLLLTMSNSLSPGWDVVRYIWDGDATEWGLTDDREEAMAEIHAHNLAKWIRQQKNIGGGYRHVKLIGESLGSRVANSAGIALSQMQTWNDGSTDRFPTVHEYFADAWIVHGWQLTYGETATYAEHGITYGDEAGTNTDISILRARNYNLIYYSGDNVTDPGYIPWIHSNHNRPMFWYRDTVAAYPPAAPTTNRGFGFDLSKANNNPWPGTSPGLWATGTLVTVTNDPVHRTDHHYDYIAGVKDLLAPVKIPVQQVNPDAQKIVNGSVNDFSNATFTATSVTLSASTNNKANFAYASFNVNFGSGGNCLDFSYYFTSTNDGKLEVFVDTNSSSSSYKLVTALREGFAVGTPGAPQWSGDLILDPNDAAMSANSVPLTGTHRLSFRLDRTWSTADSTLVITNINLSLVAPRPRVSTFNRLANGNMTLSGAATPGQFIVLQGSSQVGPTAWTALATNQADAVGAWTNTDLQATNYPQRFYRVQTQNITVTNVLPAPWQDQNIGSVGTTGSAIYAGGTFTVSGAGSNLWGNADSFNFVYLRTNGNSTIVARVATQQNTASNAKAGVMIRENLSAGSTSAYMVVTPSDGSAFGWRATSGGSTTNASGGNHPAPYWVKLVRNGNSFSAYQSPDGSAWTQVGSTQTISMAAYTYVGLCVCSCADPILGTDTFDNVTVTSP